MTPQEMADHFVVRLNEMVEQDRRVMHELIEHRVSCNDSLATHPTVQVAGNKVGLLGVLNGLIGVDQDGWGYLAADFDDSGKLVRFLRTPPRKHDAQK